MNYEKTTRETKICATHIRRALQTRAAAAHTHTHTGMKGPMKGDAPNKQNEQNTQSALKNYEHD